MENIEQIWIQLRERGIEEETKIESILPKLWHIIEKLEVNNN